MMKAEFNQKKHARGVLSMARLSGQPDSATTQFFVMHAASPHLDGQYSAFGQLLSGFDALDAIAQTPGKTLPAGGVKPDEPQRIERALVLLAE
jgi:cyclophilin family peptidyl-prolyl cis-trans isomerase